MSGFVTPRLRATPLAPGDADFLHRLWADPSVGATLGGVRHRDAVDRAVVESAAHWADHGFGRWTLWTDDERVGTVKLAWCEWTGAPEVELGYAIAPPLWNRGYATEAARGALAFARDHTALAEVIAVVVHGNARSTSVLQRLGFRYEAELPLPEGRHEVYRSEVA